MVEPLPLRLHRAVSLLSRIDDPTAADAQSACAEVAARLVMLEEALLEAYRRLGPVGERQASAS